MFVNAIIDLEEVLFGGAEERLKGAQGAGFR